MFSIAHCVRWMERPRKNFSDEIFPHCVWEKKLTGIIFNNFTILKKQKHNQFFQYCNNLNNLTYIINSIGSWDMELDFEIEDFNKFNQIMLEIRDKFSDIIKHYDFVIVMNEDKLDYYPGCYLQFK